MVELVDTQRSGRCGSNPVRVRIPLRAQTINLTQKMIGGLIREQHNVI